MLMFTYSFSLFHYVYALERFLDVFLLAVLKCSFACVRFPSGMENFFIDLVFSNRDNFIKKLTTINCYLFRRLIFLVFES